MIGEGIGGGVVGVLGVNSGGTYGVPGVVGVGSVGGGVSSGGFSLSFGITIMVGSFNPDFNKKNKIRSNR